MKSWQHDYSHWTGSAADLADLLSGIFEKMDHQLSEPKPNERLVRHYVQQRILTRPEREGKAAIFGFQQIVEFVVARVLTADGWPLVKVADFIRSSDLEDLISMLPGRGDETAAQKLIAKIKSGERVVPGRTGRANKPTDKPTSTSLFSEAAMERSADLSRTRFASAPTNIIRGDKAGAPRSEKYVRIALTDWCHVYVNPTELQSQSAAMPKWLGEALIHSLIEIRLGKGELND